jgi:14-3-3 protein epsilon
MSNVNLEDLSLQEEEGFVFDLDEGEEEVIDFRWCLVGRFLGDRSIHVNSMKVTMADIWRPVKGVKIKETTPGLFLFQFAHALDMEAVIQGGPWSFNNQMLILERVGLGVQIENIPLYHVDFWVQVHNLPTGLMAEKVGKTLANYIGTFVEYDKNNKGSFWREYMRIKVRVDVRQPLKKDSRVKNQGGAWCLVNFKYEKLGVFCFVCGLLGHGENRCAVRFSMENDDGFRAWSKDLRVEPRRRGGRQTSRWLMEEDGGRSVQEERQSQSHAPSDAHVDPTQSNTPSFSPNHNRPDRIISPLLLNPTRVPPANQNQSENNQLLMMGPAPAYLANKNGPVNTDSNVNQSLSLQHFTRQPLPQSTQQTTLINDLDKTLTAQSSPNNSPSVTSYTFSPILTDALNQKLPHQFTFNSSTVSHPNHQINPLNRLIKNNPHHKPTRTGNSRAGINLDPAKHVSDPNQSSLATMETQTEKKRRREDNEQNTDTANETQHFLTVGPGSQACRDQ